METCQKYFKNWKSLNNNENPYVSALFNSGCFGSDFDHLIISPSDFNLIKLLFENFYQPYLSIPEFSKDYKKNSSFLKLSLHEEIDEHELFEKLEYFCFLNFLEIFKGFFFLIFSRKLKLEDVEEEDFKTKKKWIEKHRNIFQFEHLQKICLLLYRVTSVIFDEFDQISDFKEMLKKSKLNKDSGLFYYFSSRLSYFFHPNLLTGFSLSQLGKGFTNELLQNLASPIRKLKLAVFENNNNTFLEFLSDFLTSPLNLPYFTLISTIKYKQNDKIKESLEYYSEGTDLTEISAEDRQDEWKPYEVGVGWELFIAKQRIFENDLDDENLVDLFVNTTNWEQQIFHQSFETHRKKYKIDQGSMFGKKSSYNNEKNYRCSLGYVFFNYVIIIKCLKSLLCLMLR